MIQVVTSSVLIPRSMELRHNASPIVEMRYLNSFLVCILIVGIILISILGLLGGNFMKLITRFNLQEISSNLLTYYLFLPITMLMCINSFFAEVLVSYKRFSAPVWLNLGLNSMIIIAVVCLHSILGGLSMMIGAFFILLLATLIFIIYMKRTLKWRFWVVDFRLFRTSLHPMGGLLANQLIVIFINTFPFFLLSQLQPGSVTLVNYAMKLVQAPYSFLQQISIVMQVKLNELNVQRRHHEVLQLTKKISSYIFAIGLLIAGFIFILKTPIVTLLYGLGNLSEDSLKQIINLIAIAIISLPFIAFGQVWAKLYFVQQRIKLYIITMVVMNFVGCIIYYAFITTYEIEGYAMAYALSESLMAIALWYRIKRISKFA